MTTGFVNKDGSVNKRYQGYKMYDVYDSANEAKRAAKVLNSEFQTRSFFPAVDNHNGKFSVLNRRSY